MDEAAAKALERADAAESAVHEKERATSEILSAMEGVSERDMAAVARAEAERAAAAETRVRALEQRLAVAAESRAELSKLLAEAKVAQGSCRNRSSGVLHEKDSSSGSPLALLLCLCVRGVLGTNMFNEQCFLRTDFQILLTAHQFFLACLLLEAD